MLSHVRFSIFLVMGSVVALSDSSFAAEVAISNCPIPYAKLARSDVLEENLAKLKRGGLTAIDKSTGDSYQVHGEFKIQDDPDPKLFQRTQIGEMKLMGTSSSGASLEMGLVRVRFKTQTKELEISNTGIYPPYQQQGLSSLAIAEALRQFPEATTITGKLTNDNASEFTKAMKAARAAGKRDALKIGLEGTPLYKAVQLRGFTEIDMNQSYYDPFESSPVDQLFIKVRKPSSP
jgi:hypothetical protein